MLDGTYAVKVDVPFGREECMVVLRAEGDIVYADIDAPIIGKRSVEGRCEGDTFTAQGSGKAKLVGRVDYTLQGVVSGDKLHIDIKSNKGDLTLEGTRV